MKLKIESSQLEYQELVQKREQEIEQVKQKAISKIRIQYLIIELVVTFAGYILLVCFANWQVALGVWLALWGNNMGFTRNFVKKENILRDIWKM